MIDKKLKHLDYIHNTINRMSNNSFIIKGWTISIVSVLFIFSNDKMNKGFLSIILLAILVFWYLNGYFLQQERKYRVLYDKIRKLSENEIDFSMSTDYLTDDKYSLLNAILGKTIWPLYLVIIIMVFIANLI